jgi:hypothetical protein
VSAILNRHFDLLNAIFVKASIFFRNLHPQIRLKIHAGPNNNNLPLKVFFIVNRTRLIYFLEQSWSLEMSGIDSENWYIVFVHGFAEICISGFQRGKTDD